MRLSVGTPVVTMLPGNSASWEESGTVEDVARIAAAAEGFGYHHLTCSEHIGVPAEDAARRGARYWDPLATFGYLAARTNRIKLATNVLVLAYHHPLEIAKRYGTLDLISNGRLVLGLGVGSLEPEFTLLGAPFDDRGARADDALRALRAAMSQPEPSYRGEFYDFGGLAVDPCAVQDRVPFWVGGRTLRSLRRAVALAEGWCPFGVSPDQAKRWLNQVDRPAKFDVVLGPAAPFAPIDEPVATADMLGGLGEAGVSIASARFVHHSLDHYIEQLEALAEICAKL